MSLIGTFPASSSAVFNLDFLPEFLLVQATDGSNQHLSNLSIVTSGVQLMSITSLERITALAKYDSGATLDSPAAAAEPSNVAMYIVASAGRINKATTITGTNSIASPRNLYAASTCIGDVARRAVEQSVNPSANATFDNFEALFFDPTHVLRCQITFDNGFSDEYTPSELSAYYAKFHIAEQNGLLQGLQCIAAQSGGGNIAQVVLYNGAGGSTVVLKTDYVQL
jgi:hypothetical protein